MESENKKSILDFIYRFEKPQYPSIEIEEERSENLNDFDTLMSKLGIESYKKEFLSGDFTETYKDFFTYLLELSNKIKEYGVNLSIEKYKNRVDEYSRLMSLSTECDQLEVNLEKSRKKYEALKKSKEIKVEDIIEEIRILEDSPEYLLRKQIFNTYTLFTEGRVEQILQLYNTNIFRAYFNKKKEKVLRENLLSLIPKSPMEKILYSVIKNEYITISELEDILDLDKIEVLKLVFSLQNKNLIDLSREDEIVRLKRFD